MQYLEVHDPQLYRRKAKGVQTIPFSMKDFYYRIAQDEKDKVQKKESKLTAAQIRARVEEMRARREKEKRQRHLLTVCLCRASSHGHGGTFASACGIGVLAGLQGTP